MMSKIKHDMYIVTILFVSKPVSNMQVVVLFPNTCQCIIIPWMTIWY